MRDGIDDDHDNKHLHRKQHNYERVVQMRDVDHLCRLSAWLIIPDAGLL